MMGNGIKRYGILIASVALRCCRLRSALPRDCSRRAEIKIEYESNMNRIQTRSDGKMDDDVELSNDESIQRDKVQTCSTTPFSMVSDEQGLSGRERAD